MPARFSFGLRMLPGCAATTYLFTRLLLAQSVCLLCRMQPKFLFTICDALPIGSDSCTSSFLTLPYTAFLFLGGECPLLFSARPRVVEATRGVSMCLCPRCPLPDPSGAGRLGQPDQTQDEGPEAHQLGLVFPLVVSWVCRPQCHPQS